MSLPDLTLSFLFHLRLLLYFPIAKFCLSRIHTHVRCSFAPHHQAIAFEKVIQSLLECILLIKK